MDPSVNAAKQHQQTFSMETDEAFEAKLLTKLEISAYDLAALERYLRDNKYIPDSTDEDTIKDAVFWFRKSYESEWYYGVFPANQRLARLFEAWTDKAVESFVFDDETNDDDELDVKAYFKLKVQRETINYNAVRTLFARLASRNKSKSGDGGESS